MFEKSIETLKKDLISHPSASMLLAARYLVMTVTRDLLPDWVEILANGNMEHWESVRHVALADINAESLAEHLR